MPSKKYYNDADVYEDVNDVEEDVFQVNLDDEGNPFIVPELHNLGMDHEKIQWYDSAYDDIVQLFNKIIEHRNNHANVQLFEKLTFNRFLIFVCENSYQIS